MEQELLHRHVRESLFLLSNILSAETLAVDKDCDASLRKVSCYARSIALAHDSLIRGEGGRRVEMEPYVRKLLKHLRQANAPLCSRLKVQLRVDIESLSLETAVICGLIITELFLNAVRHAFPETGPGSISLVAEHIGDAKCLIEMSDDGVGLPAPAARQTPPTSGLQLMRSLARKIGGNIRFDGGAGARCKVVFRNA